jgi:hypothetical protein
MIIRIDSDKFDGQVLQVNFGDGNFVDYNVDDVKETGITIPEGTDFSKIQIRAAGKLYTELLAETKLLKVSETMMEKIQNKYLWQTVRNSDNEYYSSHVSYALLKDAYLRENYSYSVDGSGNFVVKNGEGNEAYRFYNGKDYGPAIRYERGCGDIDIFIDGKVYTGKNMFNSGVVPYIFANSEVKHFTAGEKVDLFFTPAYDNHTGDARNDGSFQNKLTYFGEIPLAVSEFRYRDGSGNEGPYGRTFYYIDSVNHQLFIVQFDCLHYYSN